jgi:thiol-disulfide isomerase/thioredoxin
VTEHPPDPTTDEVPLLEEPGGRWRTAARWARDLLVLAVVALVGGRAIGWLRAPSLPESAPPFELRDVAGQAVSLSDFEGQTVVLNFWATWCGPCRLETPAFDRFARAHPDVVVLGIAADGPAGKVRKVAEELGATYPILMGDPATLAAYDVGLYPTTVVVGPDGTIRTAHAGLMFRAQLAWATGHVW